MSEDGRGTQRTTRTRNLPRAQESPRWFDDDAGPVVRPYAMTRGRTTSNGQHRLDLIAVVVTEAHAYDVPETDRTLSPEHVDIVGLCRDTPQSVAELAAELDLPIGVVRVLIGDLVDDELVHVTRPVPPAELPDESILRDVISGLRAL
ncbi:MULTISPECIES: DUF742 domain-containing protein [Streptomyces]|uniref:DUF742 domain-containing protein n=1 Tax=Streptomyces venezuelae TaxID=54571 RepID=A0A5P2CDM4_STRVZ|nr:MULTISPECIES: DUF742 domain-containing protein [Streptomyces]NEA03486.1 DUF742 domain-containing protein [Streptomyces sp. SID10116]MYY85112.1 DUF742 domain-containing protein [Streptomyces sp. SID335]MYZ19256.1 DUF742 domain-containing protein [Streptomyces sp. SID337]NDZ87104.1 DUF742 domain-containing protein [Streptomyces sp. SID10115]NEB42911.1 DUF742 domain-containing protein [Streptomyces sp. SID339]